MAYNPWDVDSIEAFTFLKCPECIFDTREENNFLEHAFENHPLSSVFFGKRLKEEAEVENYEDTNYDLNIEDYYDETEHTNFPAIDDNNGVFLQKKCLNLAQSKIDSCH